MIIALLAFLFCSILIFNTGQEAQAETSKRTILPDQLENPHLFKFTKGGRDQSKSPVVCFLDVEGHCSQRILSTP